VGRAKVLKDSYLRNNATQIIKKDPDVAQVLLER
jgi:hypothetical protein